MKAGKVQAPKENIDSTHNGHADPKVSSPATIETR